LSSLQHCRLYRTIWGINPYKKINGFWDDNPAWAEIPSSSL
jgi:hypothetical protein